FAHTRSTSSCRTGSVNAPAAVVPSKAGCTVSQAYPGRARKIFRALLPNLRYASALSFMETVEHHTDEEVRRALARIRAPTIVRLTALARNWVRIARRREAEDLLNEAISRILSGRRRWPVGMP